MTINGKCESILVLKLERLAGKLRKTKVDIFQWTTIDGRDCLTC